MSLILHSRLCMSIALLKRFFISLVALTVVSAPVSAWAQSSDEFSLDNMPAEFKSQASYQKINPVPLAYVSDIQTSISPSKIITGRFVATSGEAAGLGDIQYEILLLQPLPKVDANAFVIDDGAVYDRLIVKEPFSLLAKEKKTISFTYQPPQLPGGTYRLRIQLLTSNDRRLGWGDSLIEMTGEAAFATIETDAVLVQSVDPITRETKDTWDPLEGPNVPPATPLKMKLFATNTSAHSLPGTVTIETQRLLMADDQLTKQTGEAVTLAPLESAPLTVPVTSATVPGSYRVLISLTNTAGQRVSGLGEFRYVVEGLSASIVSQVVASMPEKKGQTAEVHFTVAGSADRVTPVNGVLEISLSNGQTKLGSVENTITIPSANPVQGVAHITLTDNRCGIPSITSTLHTADGNVLDTYTATYPSFESKRCGLNALFGNVRLLIVVGVLAAILIVAVLLLALRNRHRQPPVNIGSGTIVGVFLLIALSVLGVYVGTPAEANGIQYKYHHDDPNNYNEQVRPELYVATPNHNSEITSLQVPYAARFSWISCDNAIAAGWLRVYMKATPGQVDWFEGHQWIQAPFAKYIQIPRTCKCDSRPRRAADLSGTLQLPDMPAGSTTTIWTSGNSQGSWRGGALMHDFTWLTFKPDIDLKVEMSGPAQAATGEQVTYVATLTNLSAFMAHDVKGSVQMADGFVFDPANSSGGCSLQGATIQCTVGGVLAGTTRTFSVAGRHGAANQCGAKTRNTVELSSPSRDPNPANNKAEVLTTLSCTQCSDGTDNDGDGKTDAADPDCDSGTTQPPPGTPPGGNPGTGDPNPVPGVDAGITVAAPATVEQGALINYSLGVRNFGSASALGTKVSVNIPQNFTFNQASSSGACAVQGSNVECTLGTLAAGQSTPLAVVFTVGTSTTCNSKVTATATITTTSEDKNTANNSATSNETTITCGQCRDGKDNDGDARTDDADPACHIDNDIKKPFDPNRKTEDDTQCTDTKDNDGDTLIDEKDPGCHVDNDINKAYVPADNNESGSAPFDPGGFRVVE